MEQVIRKQFCKRGHLRTPDNLRANGACITCSREDALARYVKRDWSKKTHCVRGHERTPENLTSKGECRKCRYQRQAEKIKLDPEREAQRKKRFRNPQKANAARRTFYKNNPDKRREAELKWPKNPERLRAREIKRNRRDREEIKPNYVAAMMKIPVKNLTPELYDLARTRLTINRFLRKAKTIKEKTNVDIPCNA